MTRKLLGYHTGKYHESYLDTARESDTIFEFGLPRPRLTQGNLSVSLLHALGPSFFRYPAMIRYEQRALPEHACVRVSNMRSHSFPASKTAPTNAAYLCMRIVINERGLMPCPRQAKNAMCVMDALSSAHRGEHRKKQMQKTSNVKKTHILTHTDTCTNVQTKKRENYLETY